MLKPGCCFQRDESDYSRHSSIICYFGIVKPKGSGGDLGTLKKKDLAALYVNRLRHGFCSLNPYICISKKIGLKNTINPS